MELAVLARGHDTLTPKTFTHGTHRACTPEATLAVVTPALRDIGITRVAVVTGLDRIGIPVVMVVRPNARSLSVTQGKGLDLVAAKVSGIMEAIEHHQAESVLSGLTLASPSELARRQRVLDVSRVPRTAKGARASLEHARLLWCAGRELTTGERIFVPHELVHLDFTLPLPTGSGLFLASSNGLASGNTQAEAICHALFELIERDAVTLFFGESAERRQRRELRLTTISDPTCTRLVARLEAAGVRVRVWEVTSDVAIPAYLCELDDAMSPYFPRLGSARGMGCHSDASVALGRALCEAAQTRLTSIAGSRDDLRAEELEQLRRGAVAAGGSGRGAAADPTRSFAAAPTRAFTDFESELGFVVERLREVGLGAIALVDLSPRDIAVHVVRVVVPGLEGFWEVPGYVPGLRAQKTNEASA